MTKQRERLKVRATTVPQDLAGAIAKYITVDRKEVEVVAVGAGAVNQATKAMILARRFLSSTGADYAFKPAWETLTIKDENNVPKEITAIKWIPVEV